MNQFKLSYNNVPLTINPPLPASQDDCETCALAHIKDEYSGPCPVMVTYATIPCSRLFEGNVQTVDGKPLKKASTYEVMQMHCFSAEEK